MKGEWFKACVCATTLFAPGSWAAEWKADPWADVQVEYNDNVQFLPGHNEATEGAVVNAGLQLLRTDERTTLRLLPSLQSTRYNSSEPLNSNDQLLKGEWTRRNERGEWRLNGEWVRDTTLSSELEVSGLVQTRKPRTLRSLSPTYNFMVSPRNTVGVDLNYISVNYHDAEFTGLVDYRYGTAGLNWGYQWSEQTTLTSTLYGSRLEAPAIGNRTNSQGVQGQLSTTFGERWDGSFSAGVRHSEGSGVGVNDSYGWLANLGLIKKDELGSWQIGLSRTLDPSGTGVLVQRDQVTVTRERGLSPLWRVAVSAYWSINKDLQTVAVSQDRHYRNGSLRFSHIVSPAWRLDASYYYAWQVYSGVVDQAERNIFMIGVHYDGSQATN